MSEFVLVCLLLSLLALGFVLLPLRLNRTAANASVTASNRGDARDESNVEAFKIRLQELEQESESAHYSNEEKQALKQELKLRLLEEVNETPASIARKLKVWPVIVLVALALPIASWLMYDNIGAKKDYDLLEQLSLFQQAANNKELGESGEVLITMLQDRVQQKSDQPALWMMLGRAQTRLQYYSEAEASFQQLMELTGEDPNVMGLYAQARYMANGRKLDEVAQSIAERALEIQPNNGTVLGMLGMASFEKQDYVAAVKYWQQLLTMLDPSSPTAQMIQQGIVGAKAAAGDDIVTEPVSAGPLLTVNVSLAEGLTMPEGATVFIYARAVNGPKMPLAVVKRPATQLPVTVELDDSMAMTPTMKLSSFEQVEIVARVSLSGIANASAGDLEGVVSPVSNASADVIRVVIDAVLD